jgi:phage-related protein
MKFTVEFFNKNVQEEVFSWPEGMEGILASFTRIALSMAEHGPNLGMPYTKAFGNGLFEIRAKGKEGIGRAFFCTLVERRIVVLSGFIKKTEQTPQRELALARQRQKKLNKY